MHLSRRCYFLNLVEWERRANHWGMSAHLDDTKGATGSRTNTCYMNVILSGKGHLGRTVSVAGELQLGRSTHGGMASTSIASKALNPGWIATVLNRTPQRPGAPG